MTKIAAYTFSALAFATAIFQFTLAAGVPWGEAAWGSAFSGMLPSHMRLASVTSGLLLLLFAVVIIARAGLAGLTTERKSTRILSWLIAGFCGLSTIANAFSPSHLERVIWFPVAALLFVCAIVVARS